MTMTDAILLAVYVVGWFVACRLIYRWLGQDEPDELWMVPVFAFIWPVIALFGGAGLVIYGAYKLATGPLPSLPRLSRRRADQERIEELERALGITQDERQP